MSHTPTSNLNGFINMMMTAGFKDAASPVQTAAPATPDTKAGWLNINGKLRPHP